MLSSIWLVIKTLLILAPAVYSMIRDGKIKSGAQEEVLDALTVQLEARLKAAKDAEKLPLTLESNDPDNRDNDGW